MSQNDLDGSKAAWLAARSAAARTPPVEKSPLGLMIIRESGIKRERFIEPAPGLGVLSPDASALRRRRSPRASDSSRNGRAPGRDPTRPRVQTLPD
jgi:hypothetical protein